MTEEEITLERFYKIVGVDAISPLAPMFAELYEAMFRGHGTRIDFSKRGSKYQMDDLMEHSRKDISEGMLEKIEEARQKGLKVIYGELDTETSKNETYFCLDSFEIEAEGIYINALDGTY